MAEKGEVFYVDYKGNKRDAKLHNPILINSKADSILSQQAIELAVLEGMTIEEAYKLYEVE